VAAVAWVAVSSAEEEEDNEVAMVRGDDAAAAAVLDGGLIGKVLLRLALLLLLLKKDDGLQASTLRLRLLLLLSQTVVKAVRLRRERKRERFGQSRKKEEDAEDGVPSTIARLGSAMLCSYCITYSARLLVSSSPFLLVGSIPWCWSPPRNHALFLGCPFFLRTPTNNFENHVTLWESITVGIHHGSTRMV